MSLQTHNFEFGEFLLDAEEKILLRHGKPLPVTPKVFQLLFILVENHGRIVEKDRLMNALWADSFVEESNLTFTMRQLRKALGDDSHQPRFIETVPRRGYRFIAEVAEGKTENQPNQTTEIEQTSLPSQHGWHSRPVLYSILSAIVVIFLLSAGFFLWRGGDAKENKILAQTDSPLKFEILTSANKSIAAAISPDGKYIAYTNIANGQMSLWLRQLSSGINTQLIAPADGARFGSLEFSSDGEYIYFNRSFKDEPMHLDRISILGGAVKTNILNGTDGAFSISPDNRRISFRRYAPQKRSLLIANIDGTGEHEIFTTTKTFTDNVFSPDGKTIAFASGQSDTGDQDFGVYTINADGGEAEAATDFKWHHVAGVVWLPDQNGLLVTARLKNDEPQQLWKISIPDGEVKKITDTQNNFASISATRDLSEILLIQNARSSNLYLASSVAPDNIQPLAPASEGVVWTPEGDLIYTSHSTGNDNIWRLEANKINQKQLTTEDSTDINPQISPDGRYIAFISDRAGKYNVWRMNADGSNPVQLTNGDGEQSPVFTTDGQFVVFNSMKDKSLWQVSIEGGASEQIAGGKRAYHISISPDGTKFAHFAKKDNRPIIAVKTFPDGASLQEFAIPEGFFAGRNIVWTNENGGALIYNAEDANSVGNLWRQSLDGAPPQKLTNYVADEIFYFNFSPDGSQLALVRGSWNHDVVLVKGFK